MNCKKCGSWIIDKIEDWVPGVCHNCGAHPFDLPKAEAPVAAASVAAGGEPSKADGSEKADTTVAAETVPVDATDAAVAHAEATGVDLGQVEGTGVDGRITKPDVAAAAEANASANESPAEPAKE